MAYGLQSATIFLHFFCCFLWCYDFLYMLYHFYISISINFAILYLFILYFQ